MEIIEDKLVIILPSKWPLRVARCSSGQPTENGLPGTQTAWIWFQIWRRFYRRVYLLHPFTIRTHPKAGVMVRLVAPVNRLSNSPGTMAGRKALSDSFHHRLALTFLGAESLTLFGYATVQGQTGGPQE